MSNKTSIATLNSHLFAALDRISDEKLDEEALEREIERGRSVAALSKAVVNNATLVLDAHRLAHDLGKKPQDIIQITE